MGLDNGIILNIPSKELPKDFPTKLSDFSDKTLKETGELEVAYWRKCWGIRNAILKVLHGDLNGSGEYPIEAEDIPAILRALMQFVKPQHWEEEADSIWEYDEMIDALIDQILNLKWLQRYLTDNPGAMCFFYDSW